MRLQVMLGNLLFRVPFVSLKHEPCRQPYGARYHAAMRIAYVSDTYLPETNGIVTAIVRHSRALAERGHELLIVCPRYAADDPDGAPGITVRRYAAASARSNAETHVALPSLPSMLRTLRAFSPDVVHAHTPLPIGATGVLAARLLGIPVVQTYHSYVPGFMQYATLRRLLRLDTAPRPEADESWSAWTLTRLLYDRADLVLAPSRTLVDVLAAHGVRPPLRYQTNGIDLAEFDAKTAYAPPTRRILHVGRLGYEKHAEVVVRAFAQLASERGGWRLGILGEGPARPYLERLVRALGIEDAVDWDGFIERRRLLAAYRTADVFATASTIETQGLVVLEAMASGTPVIGVSALAVPEMAADGRDGIMVQPGDAADMAAAMRRLADDDGLRERMGRAAVRDAREHALPRAVDGLELVYDTLARHRAADLDERA